MFNNPIHSAEITTAIEIRLEDTTWQSNIVCLRMRLSFLQKTGSQWQNSDVAGWGGGSPVTLLLPSFTSGSGLSPPSNLNLNQRQPMLCTAGILSLDAQFHRLFVACSFSERGIGSGVKHRIWEPKTWNESASLASLTLQILRLINAKFLLQPHQKYYIT